MGDRWNAQVQLEHLHRKYPGTGNSDFTQEDWNNVIQKDTLSSHITHHPRLVYISQVNGDSVERNRLRLLDKMTNLNK